jgi:hypothetical protein
VEARSLFTSLNLVPRRPEGSVEDVAPAADMTDSAALGQAAPDALPGGEGVTARPSPHSLAAAAAAAAPLSGNEDAGSGDGAGGASPGLVREAAVGLALRRIVGGLAGPGVSPAATAAGRVRGDGALRLAPVVEAAEAAAQRAVLAQVGGCCEG